MDVAARTSVCMRARTRAPTHCFRTTHAFLLLEDRTCVDGQARDVRTTSKACTHDDNIIRACVCVLARVHIVLPLMGTRPVMRAATFRPAVYARHIRVLSYARPCMHASKRTYTHACLPGDMHTCQVRSWPWSLRPGAAPRARL